MAQVLVNDSSLEDIADAIRARGKTNAKFLPSEMAGAINDIPYEVTGVKGNNESTYRKGNVNLTSQDVGAKAIQTAVPTPTTSGTAIEFIDSISQNSQGVIAPTKKTVREASTNQSGLMLATDKAKLDGIENGAQVNTITGVKGDAEETYRTGNINLTPENIGSPSLEDFAECIQYRDGIYASRSPSIASVVQVGTYNIGSYSPSDKPEGVIDGTLLIIRNSLNWNMQILFPYSASSGCSLDVYYRLVNRNDYSILIDWTKVYSGTDLQNSIDSLSVAVNRYFLIDSQFISDKNATLANITEDITSIITANQWNDAPAMTTSSQSGIFINRRYSGNYQIQKYTQFDKGNEWIRVVNRNNGAIWKDWMQVTSLPPVKVLAVGDSICNGIRNNNKGFVGDLGLVYKNDGVSGATISTRQTSYKNIFTQLVDESAFTPDVIIANGGINDYDLSAPLGTASSAPVASDTQANALDKSTVLGALEYLFYTMVKKYPKAQRFFVTTHKVKYSGKYAPATPNSEGYTQTDMTDAIIAVCKMYNVNVIDVFHEGIIDTIWSQYISPTPYSQDSTVTDKYYVDNDGIHPLALGYKECYLPLVRNALEKVATVNPVT